LHERFYRGDRLLAAAAMPSPAIVEIISRELSGKPCRRILAGDGVTTSDLTITPTPGLFAGVSIDVRAAKKSSPAFGDVASAAKNLDEYQYLICSLVPSIPDSDLSKLELQKYRIAIMAAFARLVGIMNSSTPELADWVRNAKWLVEETSEAYLQAKSKVKLHPLRRAELFQYFGVPSDKIDAALRAFYGGSPQ
jgi:hypothetical protein